MARAKFFKHYLLLFLCISLLPYPSNASGLHIPVDIKPHVFKQPKNRICLNQEEMHFFELNAIKDEMMITAIRCHKQENYNASISSSIQWKNRYLESWFRKHGGNKAYLKYTTELSNIQSISDNKLFGEQYCEYHQDIFTYIIGSDTHTFINDHNIEISLPEKKC